VEKERRDRKQNRKRKKINTAKHGQKMKRNKRKPDKAEMNS
jgi:hypothetical protein